MPFGFDDETEDQKARAALLKYYSSESTVHGGFILTVAIGAFASFQIVTDILNTSPYREVLINAILGFFLTASIYLVARTLFWGTMTSYVLHVRELTVAEMSTKMVNDELDKVTYLLRLDAACIRYFEAHHRYLNFFVGVRHGIIHKTAIYSLIFFLSFIGFHVAIPIIVR
jgi:hypothetical protein